MKKIFVEIGLGNDSFVSTEIEEGAHEYRIPHFVRPHKIKSFYIRIWIMKKVFILSTNHGFEKNNKDRNKLKILLGMSGEMEK